MKFAAAQREHGVLIKTQELFYYKNLVRSERLFERKCEECASRHREPTAKNLRRRQKWGVEKKDALPSASPRGVWKYSLLRDV